MVMPSEPEEQRRDRTRAESSVPAPLNFDEFVALIVAFLAIGSILAWGLTRSGVWQSFPAAISTVETSEPREAVVDGESPDPEAGLSQRSTEPDQSGNSVLLPPPAPRDAEELTNGQSATVVVPLSPEAAPNNAATEPEEVAPPVVNIPDVPQTYWAYPFIAGLYTTGIVANFPEGVFKPDQAMTRAELAALLKSSLVSSPSQQALSFTDIAPDYWANGAINQVVEAGYMKGFPEGDFRPDQLVTREQVMVTLASGLGLQDPATGQDALNSFVDNNTLSDWARGKVAAATTAGLVVNYPDPTLLRPIQPATRAEVVAMVYQVLAAQGKIPKVDSPYVVPGSP